MPRCATTFYPPAGAATKEAEGPAVWLLLEGPEQAGSDDVKQYVLTGPAEMPLEELAQIAHRRPLVERNSHQNGKGEVGLTAYQGRSWRGYHHHVAMAMLALTWLHLHRHPLPPSSGNVDSPPAAPPSHTNGPADRTFAGGP